MLLTAFILVIGFMALAGLVAQVNQLPETTRQAADRPIYVEAQATALAASRLMADINENFRDPLTAPVSHGYQLTGRINGSLEHMVQLESARGYQLKITQFAQCAIDGGGDAVITVAFGIQDTSSKITFSVSHTVRDPTSDGTDTLDATSDTALGVC